MGNHQVIQDRREIKTMAVDDGSSSKVLIKTPPTCSSSFKLKVHHALIARPPPPAPPGHGMVVDSGVLRGKAPPPAIADDDRAGTAVRVKLVISKQELRRMLAKESVSLDDVASLMRREADRRRGEERVWCRGGWRPALESIPEGSDLSSYSQDRSEIINGI
ncbi:hypothetical protein ACP4OV_014794 [Aristida adscensionis]